MQGEGILAAPIPADIILTVEFVGNCTNSQLPRYVANIHTNQRKGTWAIADLVAAPHPLLKYVLFGTALMVEMY